MPSAVKVVLSLFHLCRLNCSTGIVCLSVCLRAQIWNLILMYSANIGAVNSTTSFCFSRMQIVIWCIVIWLKKLWKSYLKLQVTFLCCIMYFYVTIEIFFLKTYLAFPQLSLFTNCSIDFDMCNLNRWKLLNSVYLGDNICLTPHGHSPSGQNPSPF